MDIKAASNARVEGAHADGIWSANWQGDEIVTSGLDGTVKLWNVSNNNNDISVNHKATATIKDGDKSGIQSVVLSSEKVERGNDNTNRVCVSCNQAGNIDIFDVLEDSLDHCGRIDAGIVEAWSVCINPEADAIVSGNQKGDLKLWSVESRDLLTVFDAPPEAANFVTHTKFHPEGDKIAIADMSGSLRILDIQKGAYIFYDAAAHALPIRQLAFSPDGTLIYACSDDRHVTVFDIKSQSNVGSFSHPGMALSVDAAPDERHFLVGGADHSVTLWDLGMQRAVTRLTAQHTDQVWAVQYGNYGNIAGSTSSSNSTVGALSCADDGVLQFYNIY